MVTVRVGEWPALPAIWRSNKVNTAGTGYGERCPRTWGRAHLTSLRAPRRSTARQGLVRTSAETLQQPARQNCNARRVLTGI